MSADLQALMKRKQPLFDRKTIFFLIVAIVMFAVLVATMITRLAPPKESDTETYWTAEKQFQYANTLASKGLKGEALVAYGKYLELIGASPTNRAKVAYQMGNIHMGLGEYEKALASFYRVDLENPDTELASDVGPKVVECLERLGMASQARYELEARTSIGKKEAGDSDEGFGPVIARVGKEEIRLSAINGALDQLPDWMRKQYQSDDGKINFVRQYIANELLYRKAKRLGYEDNPDVRVKLRDVTKQVLVQQVVAAEIGKVIIDPRDVELYYKANIDRYAEKAQFGLSLIQVDNQNKAAEILKKAKSEESFANLAKAASLHEETKANGGVIKNAVPLGGYIASGVGNSPQAWSAIGKASKGLTDIVELSQNFYVFWVHNRTQERQRPYTEVKQQVEADYRRERQEQAAQDLLNKTLEEQAVEIYSDELLRRP